MVTITSFVIDVASIEAMFSLILGVLAAIWIGWKLIEVTKKS